MGQPPKNIDQQTGPLSTQQSIVLGELQVLCAVDAIFNHVDRGLPMWSGDGDRKAALNIIFQTPFSAPPVITLGLAGIDSAHDQNLRFRLSAHDITTTGFRIEFSTWADTHIARAAASWHALGAASPGNSPKNQEGPAVVARQVTASTQSRRVGQARN